MDRATPTDFTAPSARLLAQLMLDATREDLSLVARSSGGRSVRPPSQDLQCARGEPLMLESKADLAARQHMEDLVSIAVASAQQADEAAQRTCETNARTRRSIWAFAGISVIGTIVGIVGVVGSQVSAGEDGKIAALTKDVQTLGSEQRQTSAQLATVRSELASEQKAVATTAPVQVPARPVDNPLSQTTAASAAEQTMQSGLALPTSSLRPVTYSSSSLWPGQPQAPRQTSNRPARRVVLPPFFVELRQNVRALFR